MTRKMILALLACAAAVAALSVVGVSGAAASTTHECKIPGEESFTSGHFLDANCEKKSGAEGEYHTVPYSESTTLKRTNTGKIVISGEVVSSPFELNCETLGGNKTVSNYEFGEVMGFVGEGKILLSSCKMSKPAGCTLKSTIETVQLSESSEDLKEVLRTLFVPKEGSKLATITIEGCAIAGSYSLEGKLRSQAATIYSEEFTASSGSELTVAKKPAKLIGAFHDATEATGKTVARELP